MAVLTTAEPTQALRANISTFRYVPNRNAYTRSAKNMHKNVHSSSLPNSPKVETTQMPINPRTSMLCYLHTMETAQKLKDYKPQLCEAVWINLRNTMSNGKQTNKQTYDKSANRTISLMQR